MHDRPMSTFVVRVWSPAPGEGVAYPAALRGTVHDIRSGTGRPFRSSEELLAFLTAGLGETDSDGERPEPEPAAP